MNQSHFKVWPTQVSAYEIPQIECESHNKELIDTLYKMAGYEDLKYQPNTEIRIKNIEQQNIPSTKWLVEKIKQLSQAYTGLPDAEVDVKLRGVLIQKNHHINTHTESHESDLMIVYWPGGSIEDVGSEASRNIDRSIAPTFVIEDPSRHLTDLRLPFEERHSILIAPRPGMFVVGPAHLPHNLWPYIGDAPFVHIVAQVRITFPDNYDERF
jgi:hypothetical protein